MRLLTVLVTGATGQQGGAVSRMLLKRGHRVLAFVRSPEAPAARELEKLGAELIAGDYEEVESLEEAMRGVDAVFAMATPFAGEGLEGEVRHGRHLVDPAKFARVPHFVYSSVAGAERDTGVPHFDTKRVVEEHLRASGLAYTILAPVFFMENFAGPPHTERLREGVLALPLPPHQGLQMVALTDMAAFCARVMEQPEEFLGQRIEVASDEVTGEQAAALIAYVSEHKLRYEELPPTARSAGSEDFERMFAWLRQEGYHANIALLRRDYPEVGWHTFEDWARTQRWEGLPGGHARGQDAADSTFT